MKGKLGSSSIEFGFGEVRVNQPELAPYEILGVSPTASPAEVSAAYKVLAQIYHPDRFDQSPDAVRQAAETRMRLLNDAYTAARDGRLIAASVPRSRRNRCQEPSAPRGPGGKAWTGIPWDVAERERQSQAVAAERRRVERQRAARNGNAVARPKPPQTLVGVLAGLGLARYTNNVECRGCQSVQWLPPDWRLRLDDTQFHCSFCDRLIFAR